MQGHPIVPEVMRIGIENFDDIHFDIYKQTSHKSAFSFTIFGFLIFYDGFWFSELFDNHYL